MSFVKRPAVLTGLFLTILLTLVFLRTHRWRLPVQVTEFFSRPSKPRTPEDTVYGMLDAARNGDTKVYVDTFSEPLRQQIQQAVRESGKLQFASYLTAQSSKFQSVAVSVTDQGSDVEARLRVEYVYTNRNEVQTFHLRKDEGRWRIIGISGTDQIKTLIPYGTAVTDD
jgi:Domain of unknown function (DUF4878)